MSRFLLATYSLLVQAASGFSFSHSLLQQTTEPHHSLKVRIGFKENDAESRETSKPPWCRPGAGEDLPVQWLSDDIYKAGASPLRVLWGLLG